MTVLLYLFPVLVVLFEYVAFSSALAYARYSMDYQLITVDLLGGLVTVGENLPYDAVPNAVATLHLLSLFLSLVFMVYFLFFGWGNRKRTSHFGEEQI